MYLSAYPSYLMLCVLFLSFCNFLMAISLLTDSRQAKLQLQKAERQEKILTLEDAFEKIKRAINVSDVEVSQVYT